MTAESFKQPLANLPYHQSLLRRSHRQTIFLTVLAVILAILFVWPFLAVLGWTFNAFDAPMNSLLPIPAKFTLKTYELMINRYHLHLYLWNSIWTAAVITMFSTFFAALAGYALAISSSRARISLLGRASIDGV